MKLPVTTVRPWWKPRVRFTLRALLVVITLFMLWGGYHTNRARRERAAEEFFRARAADLKYGPTKPTAGIGNHLAWRYSQLVKLVWRERCIIYLNTLGPLSAAEEHALADLPHLETLVTGPVAPTDEEITEHENASRRFSPRGTLPPGALARILAGHQLKKLHFSQWILGDDDCQAIGSNRRLETIVFTDCQLSEAGLAAALRSPGFKQLGIYHTPVTGSQLATVPGSPSLEQVACVYTPVGQEFAAFIGRSPRVHQLCCHPKDRNTIDDSFIAALGPHPLLRDLELHSQATDASVPMLLQLPALESLNLYSRRLTVAGQDQLKQRSPAFKISGPVAGP